MLADYLVMEFSGPKVSAFVMLKGITHKEENMQ